MVRSNHQNHFNLIRMIAATLVLVSHSYVLSSGDPLTEPLRKDLGVTWGSIAVDVFFVMSGFLVTASMLRRGSIRDFVISRALRIYPGLLVALIVTVTICSIWFTSRSTSRFWSDPATWRYLGLNATLLHPFEVEFFIPGTLEGVPYAHKGNGPINGSLWTLPVELQMYLCLAGGYFLLRRLTGAASVATLHRTAKLVLTAVALSLLVMDIAYTMTSGQRLIPHMAAMFFVGGAMWCYQIDFARLWRLGGLFLIFTLLSALHGKTTFLVSYTLLLPTIVLVMAHAPFKPLLAYNRLGDYSYGMYIYAFPVQQWVASSCEGVDAWTMTLLAAPITLTFAALSWHGIEQRALAMKPAPHEPKTNPQ